MISSYKIDLLSVRIFKTRQIMGIVAATQTAERIRNLLKSNDSISIIFAAAPSQSEFLDALSVQ